MRWKATEGLPSEATISTCYEHFPQKFYWFIQHGYVPHIPQTLFHGMQGPADILQRFRHLVAGRRGGKTLSAAWEIVYYCTHPQEFYKDFYGREWDGTPLWIWALAKDYKVGRPSYLTFLSVLRKAGLAHGVHYKLHKGERYIEFYGTDGVPVALVEFKTADDPESLRGAGLDLLWIDEASFVRDEAAWNVVYPALSDKQGGVITTTTPKGKNWFWELAFSRKPLEDPHHGSVEYRSIDNPFFPVAEWEYAKSHMHPMIFAQEYMAMFDAFQGIELLGEWLHYYVVGDLTSTPDDIKLPRNKDGGHGLRVYMGIDPAISISDRADRFAMALIGVHEPTGSAFLLDLFCDRIPFPDQLKMIRTWWYKYRPTMIGIESNAYQAALAQMAATMEGFPPIVPILSKGKKAERILRMAPLFQIGKVRVHRGQLAFIDEWINYDSTLKNPKDDTLDAVEIALRTAGALLPEVQTALPSYLSEAHPAGSLEELMKRDMARAGKRGLNFDDDMGEMY